VGSQLQGSVAHSQVDIERSQCTAPVQDKPLVLTKTNKPTNYSTVNHVVKMTAVLTNWGLNTSDD